MYVQCTTTVRRAPHIVLFIRPGRFGIFQFSDTFNVVPSARRTRMRVYACAFVSYTKGSEQFVSPPGTAGIQSPGYAHLYVYACVCVNVLFERTRIRTLGSARVCQCTVTTDASGLSFVRVYSPGRTVVSTHGLRATYARRMKAYVTTYIYIHMHSCAEQYIIIENRLDAMTEEYGA